VSPIATRPGKKSGERMLIYTDLEEPNTFGIEVVASCRKKYLLGIDRLSKNEKRVIDKLRGRHIGPIRREMDFSFCN
jgi:hypothetical protein